MALDILNFVKKVNKDRGFGTAPEDFIFLDLKGNRCTSQVITTDIEVICDTLNIPVRRTHALRRTVATIVVSDPNHLSLGQRILGHSTKDMALKYVRDVNTTKLDEEYLTTVLKFQIN